MKITRTKRDEVVFYKRGLCKILRKELAEDIVPLRAFLVDDGYGA